MEPTCNTLDVSRAMSNEVTAEENEVWLCGGDRVERVTDL